MVLIDTDVLIDCWRGEPAAQIWLANVETTQFKVPGVVAMELIMGCNTKVQLQRTQSFINTFEVLWPDANDFALAYALLAQHRFTSGLSIPDCLIAAQTLNLSATLYSFNIKHFRAVQGLDVQPPYVRT